MNITQFFRLILRNLHFLLAVPLLVALLIYKSTKDMPKTYQSNVVIYAITKSQTSSATGDAVKMDYFTSSNLFDNITLILKSRETIKATSLKLLALHLSIDKPVDSILNAKSFAELRKHFSPDILSQIAVKGDPAATLQKITEFDEKHPSGLIDYLLREHPVYGITAIAGRMKVVRKQTSDMVDVTYMATDPAVCYYTLKYITEVFADRYRGLKKMENENSIAYFEAQLKQAKDKLEESEGALKVFIAENNILNYYEQGKYLDIMDKDQGKDLELEKEKIAGTNQNIISLEKLFKQYELREGIIDTLLGYQRTLNYKQSEIDALQMQGAPVEQVTKLKKEAAYFENIIRLTTDRLFANSNTEKGIEKKRLIEEWLGLKIEYEKQTQAYKLKEVRKRELQSQVDAFAPLGAELKKLERGVSVNENQYLSILNGLNMAYLKKYDLDSYTSQSLLDPPFFPETPEPSKRFVLIAGGAIASALVLLIYILATFFLDHSIKTVNKAESVTNSKVLGGAIDEKRIAKNILLPNLKDQLLVHFFNKMNLTLKKGQQVIAVVSLQKTEGKTFCLEQNAGQLWQINPKFRLFIPHQLTGTEINTDVEVYDYKQTAQDPDQFLSTIKKAYPTHLLMIEFPALSSKLALYEILKKADLVIVVIDAKRKWTSSDDRNLSLLRENVPVPTGVWLNRMKPDDLEEMIGEIPKTRSWIRRKIKKMIS